MPRFNKTTCAALLAAATTYAANASAVTTLYDTFLYQVPITIVADPLLPIFNKVGTVTGPMTTIASPTTATTRGIPFTNSSILTISGGAFVTPMVATMSAILVPLGPNSPQQFVGFAGNSLATMVIVNDFSRTVAATVANPLPGLQYSGFGDWGVKPTTVTAPGVSVIARGGAVAGGALLTTALQMPKAGTAIYRGKMEASTLTATNVPYDLFGNVALTATFTALGGTVTGSMSGITTTHGLTGVASGTFNPLTISLGSISVNGFTGTIKAGAPGTNIAASLPLNTAGTIKGHFYGPTANELTGVFRLVSGTRQVTGSYGTKR